MGGGFIFRGGWCVRRILAMDMDTDMDTDMDMDMDTGDRYRWGGRYGRMRGWGMWSSGKFSRALRDLRGLFGALGKWLQLVFLFLFHC